MYAPWIPVASQGASRSTLLTATSALLSSPLIHRHQHRSTLLPRRAALEVSVVAQKADGHVGTTEKPHDPRLRVGRPSGLAGSTLRPVSVGPTPTAGFAGATAPSG